VGIFARIYLVGWKCNIVQYWRELQLKNALVKNIFQDGVRTQRCKKGKLA
jgi:hypothetical protein